VWLVTQQLVLDLISNSRQIRAQKKTSNFVNRFEDYRAKQALAMAKVVSLGYMSRYITEIAVIVGVALFLAQRTFFGATSTISAATLTVFLAAAFRVIASMIPIQSAVATLSTIDHEGSLAFSLLSSETRSDTILSGLPATMPSIGLSSVSYKYAAGSEYVFEGLNAFIPFGSFVVVKGPSGAGKSTLVDLIVGLKTPSEGQVNISEEPSGRKLEWQDLNLGYVPQKPNLIEGTLLENVSLDYVNDEESRIKASNALETAQLGSWVRELAFGLDTRFGMGSSNLSGGQLQRLGIARALYDQPGILVLDEGTNSLDSSTELEIRNILAKLKARITIIVISHNDIFDSLATLRINLDGNSKVSIEDRL
jgi:ATP-binding cassette, subfamily B, bacterial PglK